MAHSYKSEYPAGPTVSPDIKSFFEHFYRASDLPGEHDQYVDFFTDDATFIMASKKATGSQEIMTTRIGMWSAVASRKHTVVHVFPFDDSNTFMLHGVVALGLRNGANVDVDWAARAQVVKCPDEKYRMQFYQVYLDTAAIAAKS